MASPGNDHRLGTGEAPPGIMSVFIGEELTKKLDEIEVKIRGGKMSPEEKTEIKLNWENSEYRWIMINDLKNYETVPNLYKILINLL